MKKFQQCNNAKDCVIIFLLKAYKFIYIYNWNGSIMNYTTII